MTLLQEIQSKAPGLIAGRDYQAIADAVNVGRKKIVQRLGGIGIVLETLGPTDGAALLDQLEALAATDSAVKWALVLIHRGELDFGSPATRGMIDKLVAEPARGVLKALAEVPDHVSVNDVENVLTEVI